MKVFMTKTSVWKNKLLCKLIAWKNAEQNSDRLLSCVWAAVSSRHIATYWPGCILLHFRLFLQISVNEDRFHECGTFLKCKGKSFLLSCKQGLSWTSSFSDSSYRTESSPFEDCGLMNICETISASCILSSVAKGLKMSAKFLLESFHGN